MPTLTLHAVGPSHPSMAVDTALRLKGLEFERIDLVPGEHPAAMEKIYGAGNSTVPGLVIDGEPLHGSRAIFARLEELEPAPPLFPEGIADEVLEGERWGDEELQDLGRRLPWGALYFRPEAMGTFGGAGQLDPAGTDFAIRYVRATWKYHGITAERLAGDLAGLPEKVRRIEAYAAAGVIGGDVPNAADLQIGSTLRVLLCVADLHPLLEGGVAERIARAWFPDYAGEIPVGAFPAGWVPALPA
jgi:glutathione S-transferase